jgi:hypothetical protein
VPESRSWSSRIAHSLIAPLLLLAAPLLLLAAPVSAQDAPGGGGLVCTPGERELQTRRPLPLE